MIGKCKNLSNLIKFINTSDIFDDYRDDKNNMLKKLSKYYYMYIRNKLNELDKECDKCADDNKSYTLLGDKRQKIMELAEESTLTFTVDGKMTQWRLLVWNEDFTDIDIIKSIYVLMDFIKCYHNKEGVILFL